MRIQPRPKLKIRCQCTLSVSGFIHVIISHITVSVLKKFFMTPRVHLLPFASCSTFSCSLIEVHNEITATEHDIADPGHTEPMSHNKQKKKKTRNLGTTRSTLRCPLNDRSHALSGSPTKTTIHYLSDCNVSRKPPVALSE